MTTQKYTVQQIETLGAKCKFQSMGAERDGWIMPDGVGVDYAGYAQLTFEPDTISTLDPTGLKRARVAVAAVKFNEHDFGYNYTEAEDWIEQNDTIVRRCYATVGRQRVTLLFTVKFKTGSASWSSANVFNLSEALATNDDWSPSFEKWRHGGWYVTNVRYPNGAVGCVSNNYVDGKWRIACDSRRDNLNKPGDFTFKSRGEAAKAERELVRMEALALQSMLASYPATRPSTFPEATIAVA